jgi:hypothetical protein
MSVLLKKFMRWCDEEVKIALSLPPVSFIYDRVRYPAMITILTSVCNVRHERRKFSQSLDRYDCHHTEESWYWCSKER